MPKTKAIRIKRNQRWKEKKGDIVLVIQQKHGSGWNVVNQFGTGHCMQEKTIKHFYTLLE
jgi:hypothetical protein